MAYYFAVETEKNSYDAKNIRNSKKFGTEYNTHQSYACTLQEIDFFTAEFKDENSLKEYLLKEKIIKEENINQRFVIFFLRGIESRMVSETILYSDNKSMLYNPIKIVKYIEEKAECNDFNFFRQLEETLPENTVTKSLVAKIASLIENNLVTNSSNNQLDISMVREVAKLLIYNIRTNKNGTVMYTDKINSESVHNMIVFIKNYELSLNKNKISNLKRVKTKENTSNE